MANKMNVSYDGIGIVNNIGASKYWGVTTNNNPSSYTDWRIQLNVKTKANTFYFDGCNPNENVAASIIARFYDVRETGIKNISYVKACDGVWYRVDPISRKVKKLVTGNDIPKGMIKDLPERFLPAQNVLKFDAEKENTLSQYEIELASSFINGYKTDKISKQGIELMGNIIKIISS